MTPTMVTLPERLTLRDYVAMNWVGQGEVVEIGAFAGGSAIALLQGMELARHPRPLHVYDTFKFPEGGHEETYRGLLNMNGPSFRGAFDFVTRQWAGRMRVYEGDASKARWEGGRIEFLHLDCSVSADFHRSVALEFYPHLFPGATVVNQDYGYEQAPFIAEMYGKLTKWFRKLMTIGTSAYLELQHPISREEITEALA